MVKYVNINGERYRIVKETKKKGFRKRKLVEGYRLQNYGRIRPGKIGWMNVIGGWASSMKEMNDYIKERRKTRH